MMKRPFLDDWITRCCGLDVLSEGNVLLAFLNVTVRRSGRECGPRRPTM